MEIWKDIQNYKGLYQVSNKGRVRSIDRTIIHKNGKVFKYKGIILKGGLNTSGYRCFALSKNGKTKTKDLHKLVAVTFLNHKPNGNGIVIDHIDGNTLNNNIENIQIISQRKNVLKGRTTKNKTSKYHGVSWSSTNDKWRVRIKADNQNLHLGYFKDEKQAALIARKKYKQLIEDVDNRI